MFTIHNSPFTISSLSSRNGREKRHLIAVVEDRFGAHILTVDGGGRHRREPAKEGDLPAEALPQVGHAGVLGQLARLLAAARGLSERGEMKEVDPHELSLSHLDS